MLLGGIVSPVVADVILTEALKLGSYPALRISGVMIAPIADAAAAAEPLIAPKSIFAITLTTANPPGSRPTKTFANSMSRIAIPPLFMIFPAKTKNGIASIEKLSSPDAIRNAYVVKAGIESMLTSIVIVPATPIPYATGTPNARSAKNVIRRVTIDI